MKNRPAPATCLFDSTNTQLASPQAASYFRDRTESIISAWVQMVRRQWGTARSEAQHAYLLDSLPGLMKNLAGAMENPHWHYGLARNDDTAHHHGRQRQQSHGCTVDKMVDEYAMLRHVICQEMACAGSWPDELMARIHAFLDAAICVAVREFTHLERSGKDHERAQAQRQADNKIAEAHAELVTAKRQREAADSEAFIAQADLQLARQQRDAAKDAFASSREDVAVLLEQKEMRERVIELLSHDLRSPLSSIALNAQRLIKKSEDPSLVGRIATRIDRGAQRIDGMIQDMLDASRVRAGQTMSICAHSCDIAQVAGESHEEFSSTLGSRMKLDAPKEALGIWDKRAVRRVIDNLVGNAVKYGDKHTDITITVRDAPHAVRVLVHNFGNPLSEEEIFTLFEPYVRTEAAEAGEQRGWGLGLTLVHGVVSAHDGTLGVTSGADTGTTFWFELPKTEHGFTTQT